MSAAYKPHEVWLGASVLVAFSTLTVLSFVLAANDPQLFGETRVLHVKMPGRGGLTIGDRVEIDGVPVGTVSRMRRGVDAEGIYFLIDAKVPRDHEALAWLGPGSRARVRTANVLGDTILSITGDDEGGTFAPDAIIEGVPTPGIDEIVTDLQASAATLRSLFERFHQATGAPGDGQPDRLEVITSAIVTLAENSASSSELLAERIPTFLDQLGQMAKRIEGLVGTLTTPGEGEEHPALVEIVRNLHALSGDAAFVAAQVRTSFGEQGSFSASRLEKVALDLEAAAADFKAMATEGRSVVQRLLKMFGGSSKDETKDG
ncbi:MAG: MCE family protein [Planctomycetes bacterium]|nr:MCE family protein [Planctomycetota bacterium]